MTKNKVLARNYSKENEAGRDRNSKSSSNLLDKKGGGPASDEQKRIIRRYERLVAPSENSTSGNDDDNDDDDPLEHWLAYIKFYKETFPADVRSQFLLMERCTRALVQRERYRNDVRFIRACILYADKTDFPGDVFKFLHQHRIGSTVALFWIAWAWVAETNGDFGFAEKVFLKGINKDAQPIKMLKTRHKQFQRRMSRHWLKNHTTNTDTQQEDGKNDDNNAAAEVAPNKKTFGSFAGNEAQERNDTFSSLASSRQSQQSEQADGSRQPSGGFQIFEDENRAGQSNRGDRKSVV